MGKASSKVSTRRASTCQTRAAMPPPTTSTCLCTGGRQRSEAEFRNLYQAAGFRLTRILPTQTPVKVIEGIPA
jgi:hypothetical protein